jgi:hypothetical protein
VIVVVDEDKDEKISLHEFLLIFKKFQSGNLKNQGSTSIHKAPTFRFDYFGKEYSWIWRSTKR